MHSKPKGNFSKAFDNGSYHENKNENPWFYGDLNSIFYGVIRKRLTVSDIRKLKNNE